MKINASIEAPQTAQPTTTTKTISTAVEGEFPKDIGFISEYTGRVKQHVAIEGNVGRNLMLQIETSLPHCVISINKYEIIISIF